MNAYILEDAAGSWFQYIDPEEVPDSDPGMPGAVNSVDMHRIGGWYTLDCYPVRPEQVVHPVRVHWTRDKDADKAAA